MRYGHPYLDSINIFGAKTNETIWQAIDAGVPRDKVSRSFFKPGFFWQTEDLTNDISFYSSRVALWWIIGFIISCYQQQILLILIVDIQCLKLDCFV